jgi:5-methyltetrahydropteroyltriglutamate--homocysteine methyltransferase
MESMEQRTVPFRGDIVGSFLRPSRLKQARAAFQGGALSREAFTRVEDECIRDLVDRQTVHGLKTITDGEFRRSYWHLDFIWGLHGIEHAVADQGYAFKDEETRADTAAVCGRISGENHPFIDAFRFLKSLEDEHQTARQTIPAPAQTFAELVLERDTSHQPSLRDIYPDDDALASDIAAAYRTVIADLYAAGCRNVQLDDCTWGMYCDNAFLDKYGITRERLKGIAEFGVEINNQAIDGRPADLVATSHVCRGNYHSTWAFQGSYEPIAPYLLAHERVDAFYLEFDTPRAGGFEALRHCHDDAQVVLGLVTTKDPRLEDPQVVKARIREASAYMPLDRLCLSPQCGFASTEEGNILSGRDQWAKIDLVQAIAAEVWDS